MQRRIEEIIIRKRIRKNLGDLNSLMESMKRFGLLNPVTITRENVLIAGHRRLESAKRLGWETIAVRITDGDDQSRQLEMEIEENTHRKNLTTDELAEGYIRLDKLKHPGFFRRIWLAIVNFFRKLFGRK
ncbi:MAG: ParB N-terminal domain-containing protein [Spirochaetia bacterium]